MATTKRQQRVNHLVQQEIGKLLEFEIEDPRLAGLTISGVEVSADLRHARIYVIGPAEREREKEALTALDHAKPFLRRELGQRIQLRLVPELDFVFDHSIDRGSRIDELLRAAQSSTRSE